MSAWLRSATAAIASRPRSIQHAIWLYLRFTLSYRDVEELLAERGLDISYETVRRWVLKFGPAIAVIWTRWWCASRASVCICGVLSMTRARCSTCWSNADAILWLLADIAVALREAFIASQRHEGWICLRAGDDDGGFSGATTDRPARQRLLADITAGRASAIISAASPPTSSPAVRY